MEGRYATTDKGNNMRIEEAIKSQKARCEIALILIRVGRFDLLPTEVEDIHFFAQDTVEWYCTAKDIEADETVPIEWK